MGGNKNSGRRATTEYAIYEEDELLGVGTAKELAEQLGVIENTIRGYVTRPGKLRYGIKLDEEE